MADIKISELSIGDWVRVINQFYAQIDGYHSGSGSLSLKTRQGNLVHYRLEDIHPIPLTAEILEKNGFRKLDRFNEYVIGEWDSNPFIAVRLAEKFVEPTILVKNGGTSAHLFGSRGENVHQLQHALRLAGVEKEIDV